MHQTIYGSSNSMSCMQYFKRPFAVYGSRNVKAPLCLHHPNWGYILIAHTRCPLVFANSHILQNVTSKTCNFCNYFAQILYHPFQFAHYILVIKNFGFVSNPETLYASYLSALGFWSIFIKTFWFCFVNDMTN